MFLMFSISLVWKFFFVIIIEFLLLHISDNSPSLVPAQVETKIILSEQYGPCLQTFSYNCAKPWQTFLLHVTHFPYFYKVLSSSPWKYCIYSVSIKQYCCNLTRRHSPKSAVESWWTRNKSRSILYLYNNIASQDSLSLSKQQLNFRIVQHKPLLQHFCPIANKTVRRYLYTRRQTQKKQDQ